MLPTPPIATTRHGSGDPLLLIHGDFNAGAQAWRKQLSRLHHRDLLVLDRRGYGASVPATGPFTFAGDAADAIAAADDAGWERFDLAGHSYGGLVAIQTALLAPERIHSLMLIEPPYMALLPDDPDVISLRDGVADVWRNAGDMSDEEIALGFFSIIAGHGETARMRKSRSWLGLVAQAGRAVQGESPALFPTAVLTQLPENLPVAVLTGERSNPGLQAIARELVRRIPGASLHVSPESGHGVQFDAECFETALDELHRRKQIRVPIALRSGTAAQ